MTVTHVFRSVKHLQSALLSSFMLASSILFLFYLKELRCKCFCKFILSGAKHVFNCLILLSVFSFVLSKIIHLFILFFSFVLCMCVFPACVFGDCLSRHPPQRAGDHSHIWPSHTGVCVEQSHSQLHQMVAWRTYVYSRRHIAAVPSSGWENLINVWNNFFF